MAALMNASVMSSRSLRPVVSKPTRVARKVVVCRAENHGQKLALPLAAAVASVMISGAFFPEEALAAKSGGRAGGSSFASRKAAPASSTTTTTSQTTIVNNYVAPPTMYAPSPFGFGGFSIMPTFFVPIPLGGFGAIFGAFFLIAMLGAAFNVVRSISETSSTTTTTTKKTNTWDD